MYSIFLASCPMPIFYTSPPAPYSILERGYPFFVAVTEIEGCSMVPERSRRVPPALCSVLFALCPVLFRDQEAFPAAIEEIDHQADGQPDQESQPIGDSQF